MRTYLEFSLYHANSMGIFNRVNKKVSQYDQEMPKSFNANQPMALSERDAGQMEHY